MSSPTKQLEKLIGKAMVRGKERWMAKMTKLIFLELELIRLELDLFLAGGPIPGENK